MTRIRSINRKPSQSVSGDFIFARSWDRVEHDKRRDKMNFVIDGRRREYVAMTLLLDENLVEFYSVDKTNPYAALKLSKNATQNVKRLAKKRYDVVKK